MNDISAILAKIDADARQYALAAPGLLESPQQLSALRRQRGRLQTAGLICPPEQRAELVALLVRAGVTRITAAGALSHPFLGENHDGEFPLRRYVRMVDVEESPE